MLIAHALTGNGWDTVALGHLGIVAALTVLVLLLERSQIDTGALQTFTLLTFAGGPIGGAAALLGEQQVWRPKADALESWYSTMAPKEAPAVTLVDLIIDGRLVQPALAPAPSL